MAYKPLREILSELDAQQRKELAALTGRVDEGKMKRIRSARRQLSTAAVFFIEQSWERIAPCLSDFSLEAETGKTAEEVRTYLEALRQEQHSYAWGWVRARMDARLMLLLEACVP